MGAIALEIGLGLLVVAHAGTATGLVAVGIAFALVLLAVGLLSGSDATTQGSLAVLGLILLARLGDRVIVAPLYGAGLLGISELARTFRDLRRIECIGPGALGVRLTIAAASAGLGGCAATLVAVAVAGAPGRSVAMSAAGTVAVGLGYAGIVVMARREPAEHRGRTSDRAPRGAARAPAGRTAPSRSADDGRSRGSRSRRRR